LGTQRQYRQRILPNKEREKIRTERERQSLKTYSAKDTAANHRVCKIALQTESEMTKTREKTNERRKRNMRAKKSGTVRGT